MSKSIFTQIIERSIPAHVIYENESVIAFLDISPVAKGHTLVVPKVEVEFIWDLEDEDYKALMDAVKLVGRHLREKLNVPYVGQQVVGVDVPHTHVHVIPFSDVSEYRADSGSYEISQEEMAALADELKIS